MLEKNIFKGYLLGRKLNFFQNTNSINHKSERKGLEEWRIKVLSL
jgi:hypothetical protein